MIRLQIYHSKTGPFRYTSNLDLLRAWERTFRRSGLKLAYSQGFHPQPKINLANPLPLGFIGQNELVEVWFDYEDWDQEFSKKIETALPPGLTINKIIPTSLNAPAPQSQIIAALYLATLAAGMPKNQLEEKIQLILNCKDLFRERRGKKYDLRPLIDAIALEEYQPETTNSVLSMRLAAGNSGSGRPDEVLSALGFDPNSAAIERVELIFS